jgi:hypothetical protein
MRYIKRFIESYNQEEMEYSEIKVKRNRSIITGKLVKNSYSLYVDELLWTQVGHFFLVHSPISLLIDLDHIKDQ